MIDSLYSILNFGSILLLQPGKKGPEKVASISFEQLTIAILTFAEFAFDICLLHLSSLYSFVFN